MRFIDTHVHLWDLSKGIYAWVEKEAEPLRRNFSLSNYLSKNTAPAGIVTVEAASSPFSLNEVKWINNNVASNGQGIKVRHIAFIDVLQVPLSFQVALEEFLLYPIVTGFRHILSYSNISKYSPCDSDATINDEQLANLLLNLQLLKQHNYIFECQMYPQQLIRAYPVLIQSGVSCVIDHCGLPILDKGQDEYQEWLNMLDCYKNSNIMFKLSGFDLNDNISRMEEIISTLLKIIPPINLLFGSNYPLSPDTVRERLILLLKSNCTQQQVEMILFANANKFFKFGF